MSVLFTVVLAAIAFGPPGPIQHQTYRDGTVRADVAYRIAHDRLHDTGPAAVSPSIVSGVLRVRIGKAARTYDLSRLLPIATHRIVIPDDTRAGCGTAKTFVHLGTYLALEAILAEKGCAPLAAFVDLRSGVVAESVVRDPRWLHRFDARPQLLVGRSELVENAERVVLPRYDFSAPRNAPTAPWPFDILRLRDASGRTRLISYEVGESAESLPATGSHVSVGSIAMTNPELDAVRYFDDQEFVRYDAADESRYEALQTPTPPDVARTVRRNHFFLLSEVLGARGDFDGAIRALENVVALDSNSDLLAGDQQHLARCRDVRARARAGTLDAREALTAFENYCTIASR